MSWEIRPYTTEDFPGCVDVIKSNTPTFFDPSETEEFQDDLTKRQGQKPEKQWPYFVLLVEGQIKACGGYFLPKPDTAVLIWGMVSEAEHKKGYGSKLLEYRLRQMPPEVKVVELDTTPASFGFFKKFGFVEHGLEKDGYGPGLDKVLARLERS